ncbi:MAG: hypothetical protein ACR2GA_04030 [Chloroflexota bacterium]
MDRDLVRILAEFNAATRVALDYGLSDRVPPVAQLGSVTDISTQP